MGPCGPDTRRKTEKPCGTTCSRPLGLSTLALAFFRNLCAHNKGNPWEWADRGVVCPNRPLQTLEKCSTPRHQPPPPPLKQEKKAKNAGPIPAPFCQNYRREGGGGIGPPIFQNPAHAPHMPPRVVAKCHPRGHHQCPPRWLLNATRGGIVNAPPRPIFNANPGGKEPLLAKIPPRTDLKCPPSGI